MSYFLPSIHHFIVSLLKTALPWSLLMPITSSTMFFCLRVMHPLPALDKKDHMLLLSSFLLASEEFSALRDSSCACFQIQSRSVAWFSWVSALPQLFFSCAVLPGLDISKYAYITVTFTFMFFKLYSPLKPRLIPVGIGCG